jgi:hypothetical protein
MVAEDLEGGGGKAVVVTPGQRGQDDHLLAGVAAHAGAVGAEDLRERDLVPAAAHDHVVPVQRRGAQLDDNPPRRWRGVRPLDGLERLRPAELAQDDRPHAGGASPRSSAIRSR